jgi:hypothetical protein
LYLHHSVSLGDSLFARATARLTALLCGVLLVLLAPSATSPAGSTSLWAPAATARIHPGVQMFTDGAQCTANFVFTDSRNRVYVGYAAHCAGMGGPTSTNGCETASHPLGTTVRFGTGANLLTGGTTVGYGKLAYSSWRTMQRRGVTAENPCSYNDFALVRVNAAYVGRVNPSMPQWGGPVGLDTDGVPTSSRLYSVGSSSLRLGGGPVAKTGTVLGQGGGGWTYSVRTSSPGIPGDSGSGFLGPDGRAMGTLSTLALFPQTLTNGVGNLHKELRYAQRWSGIEGLRLVRGTRSFSTS